LKSTQVILKGVYFPIGHSIYYYYIGYGIIAVSLFEKDITGFIKNGGIRMGKPNIVNWIILVLLVTLVAMAAVKWFGPKAPPTIVPGPDQGSYSGASFDPKADINSHSFASVEELNSFISSNSGSSYGYYRRLGGGIMAESGVADGAMVKQAMDSGVPSAAPNTAGGGNDFSETNNQVANVDEADLIKTDGDYIYTVSGNTLFIIKAYPGEEAEIVSTTVFKNMDPSNLFIDGDHLAVFGNFYDNDYFNRMDIRPRSGMTFFNIYDISDKAEPSLVKEYKFEGNYMNARMKEGFVYFVTQTWPEARPYPMPLMIEGATVKMMPIDNIHYFNIPYNYPTMVSVYALNLNSPEEEPNSASLMVEGGQNLYMSEDNIFLTYTEYINEYQLRIDITKAVLEDKLSDSDLALIEKIKATDNDVLSQYEKQDKIMQVYYDYMNYLSYEEQNALNDEINTQVQDTLDSYDHLEYTVINKIHVDGSSIEVGGTGKVPGHVMNQFSMDESNGVFRIATTISPRWSYSYTTKDSTSTKSTNGVYTLDGDLNEIGKLEDLAEDESIYSTRFIGDRLYMVTFRQVDPFFVIDLSDPAEPKELGKLKIPGFSRYLHPYDENTIIGIGNEATDSGRVEGLKICLFDVSDVEHPKELAKFVTEEKYATSTALYEHKAFLFSKDKELLVIPAYSYDYDYYGGTGKGYNGAFVFRITPDEITLRGLIDHSQSTDPYYYGAQVERSLYINELLYTKSMGLLRINQIDDLTSVKSISLKQGSSTDIPVY